ncbi:Agamous-like MADS-box protein AGL62 [Glycine soja]
MDTKSVPSLNDGNVKKTKGRQKIEMKKISNERYLQATFSKRRTGIFKKASELATLCDVDLAVIVFSPGNRVFSFGSPHVDSVIQRYIAHAPTPPTLDLNEPFCTMDERGLHAHLDYLANRFTREKKREEDLNRGSSSSHVNSAVPMQNPMGVIDGTILCYRQFNDIQRNGPTPGLF